LIDHRLERANAGQRRSQFDAADISALAERSALLKSLDRKSFYACEGKEMEKDRRRKNTGG